MILRLLYGSLDPQLASGFNQDGSVSLLAGETHDPESFWERAVGVFTPPRVRTGRVTGRLRQVSPGHDGRTIWKAMDTVQRFQGQQRDIVVDSFGLGGPDLIRAEDAFYVQPRPLQRDGLAGAGDADSPHYPVSSGTPFRR